MGTSSYNFEAGVVRKHYILGSRGDGDTGSLNLGRYLALDGSTGSHVRLDALHPHAILICGKRGYGKSYTMGTIIEELMMLPDPIRQNIASLVIDTMGIYWTMEKGNHIQSELLEKWGLEPQEFNTQLFVPSKNVEQYRQRNIDARAFSIQLSHLSGYEWCRLLGIDEVSGVGILIIRVIEEMREEMDMFSFDELIENIMKDTPSEPLARSAAENYFRAARSWGVFSTEGVGVEEIIKRGTTSILDVSTIKDNNVRSMVVDILSRQIYMERLEARRSYERRIMGDMDAEKGLPMVWMFIDEAHLFVPSHRDTMASDALINEWLRQGRQPGLSIIFATQRPSAIHPDVISQSDMVICHRLTARDDIASLEAIRPTYMKQGIAEAIRNMGMERGVAFIVDDTSEAAHIVRMRPRISWHGGDEPSALIDTERVR